MKKKSNRTGLKCSYCKIDPGPNPGNKSLWNGFFDKETGDSVCWNCHDKHYKKKTDSSGLTTYTEFPIPICQIGLFTIIKKEK